MALPSGYIQLEYIRSSGTQYVNTGFKPNNNTKVVISAYNDDTNSVWMYGSWSADQKARFAYGLIHGIFYGNTSATLISSTIGKKEICHNKNAYSLNEKSGTLTANTFSCPDPMYLFGVNSGGTLDKDTFIGKIYSCQVYDNGTLVRDFIPCTNASGTVGMWDDVNSVFYGNSGSGSFVAGTVYDPTAPKGKHNTLIDGTSYPIIGGRTLIGGTGYDIAKGRTLVGGSGYDILFDDGMRTIRVTGCGKSSSNPSTATNGLLGVEINGTYYPIYVNHVAVNIDETFELPVGTIIICHSYIDIYNSQLEGGFVVNGVNVNPTSTSGSTRIRMYTYEYEVVSNATISFNYKSETTTDSRVYITEE